MLGENPARVGYLLKDRVWDGDSFADAVRRVAEGGSALDPEVVSHMLGHRRLHEPFAELTPREQDVPGLMAEGRSNQAIADTLVISGRAVEKHVSGIFTKLNPPYAQWLPGGRGERAAWFRDSGGNLLGLGRPI